MYNVLGQSLDFDFDGRVLRLDYKGVIWLKIFSNGSFISKKIILR